MAGQTNCCLIAQKTERKKKMCRKTGDENNFLSCAKKMEERKQIEKNFYQKKYVIFKF